MSTPDGIYLGKLMVHLSLKWAKNKVTMATGQGMPLPTRNLHQPASKEEESPQPVPAQSSAEVSQAHIDVSPHKPQQAQLVRVNPQEGSQPVYQEPQGSSTDLVRKLGKREPPVLSTECRNVLSELLERSKQLHEAMTESMSTQPQEELHKRFQSIIFIFICVMRMHASLTTMHLTNPVTLS